VDVKTSLRAAIVAAAALLASELPAVSADRWQEAGSGAVAILPTPKPATVILGGSLYCYQQSWAFLFRLAPDSGLLPGSIVKAKLAAADDNAFALDAEISEEAAKVSVPRSILVSLKEGGALKVELGTGKGAPKTTFGLRDSKSVIEAIEPRCSQVDMSSYKSVSLSQTDAAVAQATKLLADEIKLFRNFTFIDPVVSTVVLDLADGKRLMFASLCGSKSYFGSSGCSLTGYAAHGAGSTWTKVYETEGVLLYLDPGQSAEGWPNLVTLPVVGGTQPTHWGWNGEAYAVIGDVISGGAEVEEQGDTSAQ
jgi:hypothetical protein